MNLYASKIPMSWVSTKEGPMKFLEFKNAKDPKGTIYYALRQNRPEEFQLSKNFDAAMIEAIKAKGGIKTNMIIVKDVTTTYKGKLWMKVHDGCEIIVLDAVNKKPIFRKVVNGKDDFSNVKQESMIKLTDLIKENSPKILTHPTKEYRYKVEYRPINKNENKSIYFKSEQDAQDFANKFKGVYKGELKGPWHI